MSESDNAFGARDLIASASVAVVLIPQALAYAALAGMPPVHGLYAAALAPIAAAPFVSSRYLQTGPVALTSILTFGALSTIAVAESPQYVQLAALLALMVGGFRIMFGLGRGGWLAYLMSRPVLTGFMTAAAILITASQIPTLLGVTELNGGSALPAAVDALRSPGSWHIPSLVLGIATLAYLYVSAKLKWKAPAIPVAVVVVLLGGAVLGFSGPTVGALPTGLPDLGVTFDADTALLLVLPSAVIALVGFAEAAAIARHYAAQERSSWDPNREFIGQGAANIAAGLAGGFPVGGSFSRTSINHRTGGKSKWVGAATGVLVLLFIPLSGLLAGMPRTILAAIVVSAVVPLMDFKALIEMTRLVRLQATVAWTTFLATLLLAPRVDLGVVIGVTMAILAHLWRELRVTTLITFRDAELRIEPIGVLFFGSAPRLENALVEHLAAHPDATRLVVDLQRLGRIDYTGALALRQMIREAKDAGLEVVLARVPDHAARVLSRILSDKDVTYDAADAARE